MKRARGVTGLMRVKNDGVFIERCITSCIDALDQLVIVYNDCTDNSAEEIEKMRRRYPNKIDVYEYCHKVYGANINKAEFEVAKGLPNNSPHLLCNYYNFTLAKAKYEYALKIDADQIYFSEELKKWCDFCRQHDEIHFSPKIAAGAIFQKYLSFYRWLSLKQGKLLPIMPAWMVKMMYPVYLNYAKYLFVKDKAALSLAGVNVFEATETFVSLGRVTDELNVLPPFNGEGDHLIFKISDQTRYVKFEMPYYNTMRSTSYSLIEEFKHPYRVMFLGFLWVHINSMRPGISSRIASLKELYPNAFEPIESFINMDFSQIEKRCDVTMFRLFQRILFSFVYKANRDQLKRIIS